MQTLSFQAPAEMNQALEAFAKQMDRSKAYLIRQAIAEYLEDLADMAEAAKVKSSYNPLENISFAELKRLHGLTQ